MRSLACALAGLLLGAAGPAAVVEAQQDVPIGRDLRRLDRIDRHLGIPDDGGRRVDPNVTPDNPDGVVGFDGPPSNYGDPGVIGEAGPLPPGSPSDSDDDWY